jgi:hypothetical protein
MSSLPNNETNAENPPVLLASLARNRKNTGYALLGIAVVFALIPLWMVYHYKVAGEKPTETAAAGDKKSTEESRPTPQKELRYVPVMIWGGAIALIFMGAGVWYLLAEEMSPLNPVDATRLMVLAIGGLSGLMTVLLVGLALPYFEWGSLFTGGVETWRKEWWRIAITMVALFGGLAMMFASLQLARTDERSNPVLRRLLYGFNAVLTGLLVLAILIVLNVSTYVSVIPAWGSFFSKPSDWTEASLYTLSPASKALLASIDQPLQIYVLLPRHGDRLFSEMENLMENFRAANRRIEVEFISPDQRPEKTMELMKNYSLTESMGILLVYGKQGTEEHEFISRDDLGKQDPRSPEKFTFEGENALMTSVRLLTEGKSKAVIYFAQGDGELELKDHNESTPDQGLGLLQERLDKSNYQVKELRLNDPTLHQIPDDAAIVVIARPSMALSQNALKALNAYMNPTAKDSKKGKLVVLMDVVKNRDGSMVQTGLEPFLEQFRVKVNNDRLLIFPNNVTRFPLQTIVVGNRAGRNSLVVAFRREQFLFTEVRTLQTQGSDPNNPFGRYSAEAFLLAPDGITLIEHPPFKTDPTKYVLDLLKEAEKDQQKRNELQGMLTQQPPIIAAVVTEPKEPSADFDPHAAMRGQKQEPRLVVFGDASWMANQGITRPENYDLFISILNWLRERPEMGEMAKPKDRQFFTLSASPEGITRLHWLPGSLICLAIIGLGGGIWIIRRR